MKQWLGINNPAHSDAVTNMHALRLDTLEYVHITLDREPWTCMVELHWSAATHLTLRYSCQQRDDALDLLDGLAVRGIPVSAGQWPAGLHAEDAKCGIAVLPRYDTDAPGWLTIVQQWQPGGPREWHALNTGRLAYATARAEHNDTWGPHLEVHFAFSHGTVDFAVGWTRANSLLAELRERGIPLYLAPPPATAALDGCSVIDDPNHSPTSTRPHRWLICDPDQNAVGSVDAIRPHQPPPEPSWRDLFRTSTVDQRPVPCRFVATAFTQPLPPHRCSPVALAGSCDVGTFGDRRSAVLAVIHTTSANRHARDDP